MRKLDLSCNELQELKHLEGIENLSHLQVFSNNLTSLQHLDVCTDLVILDAQYNKLLNLSGLERLTKLTSIHVEFNALRAVSELAGLRQLKMLDISNNSIKSIKPLTNLSALTSLNISDNPIGSIVPLSNLVGLVDLTADSCGIRGSSLRCLRRLSKLQTFSVGYNVIDSIANFPLLENVADLSLAGNGVVSLENIHALLPMLTVLDLRDTALKNFDALEPLSELECLAEISVVGCPFYLDQDDVVSLEGVKTWMKLHGPPTVEVIDGVLCNRALDEEEMKLKANGGGPSVLLSTTRPLTAGGGVGQRPMSATLSDTLQQMNGGEDGVMPCGLDPNTADPQRRRVLASAHRAMEAKLASMRVASSLTKSSVEQVLSARGIAVEAFGGRAMHRLATVREQLRKLDRLVEEAGFDCVPEVQLDAVWKESQEKAGTSKFAASLGAGRLPQAALGEPSSPLLVQGEQGAKGGEKSGDAIAPSLVDHFERIQAIVREGRDVLSRVGREEHKRQGGAEGAGQGGLAWRKSRIGDADGFESVSDDDVEETFDDTSSISTRIGRDGGAPGGMSGKRTGVKQDRRGVGSSSHVPAPPCGERQVSGRRPRAPGGKRPSGKGTASMMSTTTRSDFGGASSSTESISYPSVVQDRSKAAAIASNKRRFEQIKSKRALSKDVSSAVSAARERVKKAKAGHTMSRNVTAQHKGGSALFQWPPPEFQ